MIEGVKPGRMWCPSCHQDVPGVAAAEGQIRCARCQTEIRGGATNVPSKPHQTRSASSRDTPEQSSNAMTAPLRLQTWEVDQDLQQVDSLLRRLGRQPPSRSDLPPESHQRIDQAHTTAKHSTRARARSRPGKSIFGFCSWVFLSLGLMSLVFGASLLGWSVVAQRPDLWQLGLPFTLGGQAVLILGLVFQLEGLWRNSRVTTETLEDLDHQLDELQHTTTMLTTSHSSPSQSFYAHMAEGASPHLLLADLKGQLDLLATRMGDQRK